MKPLIITHKNCVDGCCSKAILRSKFGSNARYLELDHSNLDISKDPEATKYINQIISTYNSEIFVSDFCLNTEMIDLLLKQNNKVIILDHNDNSILYIEPFEKRIAAGEKLNMDIHFAKTNHCSGAMLTWQYLYPGVEPPNVVKYVSDGDIWKFEFGNKTKHFYTGILESHGEPKAIPERLWDNLLVDEPLTNTFINIGEPIYTKFMNEVMSYSEKAVPIKLLGKEGLMVEAPKKYTSDLGNQLALMCEGFGLVYNIDEENGVVRCSLRSINPITVNDLALQLGGGGHPQASAFRCKDLLEFQTILQKEGNIVDISARKKFKL